MIIPFLLTLFSIYFFICHPDTMLVSGNSFSLQRVSLFFIFPKEVSLLVCVMYICQIYRLYVK